MSVTRLLVLGVVRMYGTAHGYQVRRELLTWSADKWANVAPGSIYHALKKLARDGLVTEVDEESDSGDAPAGRGPDRIAYRLTEDGETEFQVLVAKSLAEGGSSSQGAYDLSAGVTFLTTQSRDRALSLLRHRLVVLEGERANARSMVERGSTWGEPEHVAALYRLGLVITDAVLGWVRDLVRRLESGEYVMADDEGTEFGAPHSCG